VVDGEGEIEARREARIQERIGGAREDQGDEREEHPTRQAVAQTQESGAHGADATTRDPASFARRGRVSSRAIEPLRVGGRTMGGFIYICGPSGAGKESLIAFAFPRLAALRGLELTPRYMTRPAEPGSPHRSLAVEEFARWEARGAFCMSWSAHGYRYGVHRDALEAVRAGRWVMVSASREYLPTARALFPNLRSILVTAPKDLLARRLERRGRESREAIRERVERNGCWTELEVDRVLVTVGPVEQAGVELVAVVERWTR